jgi:hypothetical protein
LRAGETAVVYPSDALRDGARVEVKETMRQRGTRRARRAG